MDVKDKTIGRETYPKCSVYRCGVFTSSTLGRMTSIRTLSQHWSSPDSERASGRHRQTRTCCRRSVTPLSGTSSVTTVVSCAPTRLIVMRRRQQLQLLLLLLLLFFGGSIAVNLFATGKE